MKKLFALILAVCAIAITFVGCDVIGTLKPTEETLDPTAPKDFKYGAMSITLPAAFKEIDDGHYKSDDYVIRTVRAPFSSITPLEGYDFPTLEEFMKNFYSFNEDPDKIVIKSEGGMPYIDYVTTSDNIASVFKVEKDGDTQCIVGFASENAFWIISFYSSTLDYETAKHQALEWAKTVKFAQ